MAVHGLALILFTPLFTQKQESGAMTASLTDLTIPQIKPGKSRRELPDKGRGSVSGLYLTVHPSGKKVWTYRYRSPTDIKPGTPYGKHKKLTLGTFGQPPLLGVKPARKAALEAAAKVEAGIDPASEKKKAKAKARDTSDLIKVVGPKYIAFRAERKNWKPRYREEAERMLQKEVLPRWGGRRIQDITRDDIYDLLSDIIEDQQLNGKRGTTANGVYATIISPLLRWAANAHPPLIDASPCPSREALVDQGLLAEKRERERVLDDFEIQLFWQACNMEHNQGLYGRFYKLALLTGQRRSEIAQMTWSELNLAERIWTLPGERTKNSKSHIVHLGAAAVDVIQSIPRVDNEAGYVFCTNGRSPISGYSKAKNRIAARMVEMSGSREIPNWTPHDLRRTLITRMNENLRIRPEVVEAAVNHVSGLAKQGVAGVYNRATYLPEREKAFERWGEYLLALVNGEPTDNVVNLHG